MTVAFAAPAPPPAPVPETAPAPPEPLLQKRADANAPAELAATTPRAAPIPPSPPVSVSASSPHGPLARGDALDTCTVSIAIPDSYLQAAVAARERSGPAAPSRAAVEAAELERIRVSVTQMIPATVEPQGQRVMITRFPTAAPPQPRREAAFRGPNPPQPQQPAGGGAAEPLTGQANAAAENVSLAQLLEQFVTSDKRLDARKLPREVWLAALSICVGLLAGLLWWIGARGQSAGGTQPLQRRAGHPQIDWSRVDRDGHDDRAAEYHDAVTAGTFSAGMAPAAHDSAHDHRAAA